MPYPALVIIDDDPDDIHLFQEALKDINKEALLIDIQNSEKMIEQLDTLIIEPDFIFLDLNMPRVSGKQCLKILKAHPSYQQIPVIIFSTSTLPSDVYDTEFLGAAYFLSKASDFTSLKNSIKFILSGKWQQHSASKTGW